MVLKKSRLRNIIKESVRKVLTEAKSFDDKDPINMVSMAYDPNIRYGKEWAEKGGNFPIMRNGRIYYVSRSSTVSLYAFAKDRRGNWYVLANKRGQGAGKGSWNTIIGYLDMAPEGKQNETLEMAACREAYEENGVKLDPSRLVRLSVNSERSNVHTCFYTVITDRTVEQMPCSNENSEVGESIDPSWIPLDSIDKFHFAFNQNTKIKAIAEKVLGEKGDRVNRMISMLKARLGSDQESQYLLDQIIRSFMKN